MKQPIRTFLLIALIACAAHPKANAQDGKISGLPAALSVHEGQIFEITFFVNPGTTAVSVVDFILNYDPEYLEALSIDRVDSPLDKNQIKGEIKPEKGRVHYGAFKLTSPWPTVPFQLLKVSFKALRAVERTLLDHPAGESPYTAMAFEGRNTMAVAAATEIRILGKGSGSGSPSGRETTALHVDSHSNPADIAVSFTVKAPCSAQLILREKNGNKLGMLYDHEAFPNEPYRFVIDSTVLPRGAYQIDLVSPDGINSKEFNTEGS